MIKKTKVESTYQCEICKSTYSSEAEALKCESRPILQNKGAKVGDLIRITAGEGMGETARVTRTYVIDKDWGHYKANLYWHTIGIEADLVNSWGTRSLTFDSYVLI